MRRIVALLLLLLLTGVVAPATGAPSVDVRLLDVDAPLDRPPDVERVRHLPLGRTFPYREHGSWLLVLPRDLPAEPRLVIETMVAGTVTLVLPDGRRVSRSKVADDPDPDSSAVAIVFALPPGFADGTPFLMHFAHKHRALVDFRVMPLGQWHAIEQETLVMTAVLYTALLAFALASACFWLMVRERIYGEYALFLVVSVAFMASNSGALYRVPGFEWFGAFGIHGQWALVSLLFAFAIGFARDFLDVPRWLPKLRPAFDRARTVLLVAALVVLVSPFPFPWYGMATIVAVLVIYPLLIAAGVAATIRGERYAPFFLAGWIPVTVATVVRALHVAGVVDIEIALHVYAIGALVQSVVLMLGLADRLLRAHRERDQARHVAERDALTGLLNRRAIDQRLHTLVAESLTGRGRGLAMLFIDVDHFKHVNDTHGHAFGDAVLVDVAHRIGHELRNGDDLGRWGGEEFVALLPGAGVEDARRTSERVRLAVAHAAVAADAADVRVTISIGIAVLDPTRDDAPALIARADSALYRAKAGGRNRVEATMAIA